MTAHASGFLGSLSGMPDDATPQPETPAPVDSIIESTKVIPPWNSYAQNGEDTFARAALASWGEIAKPRFIDIGAADGRTLSNTRAFYEAGWKGVVVEASPNTIKALLDLYTADPDITIVNAAVALDNLPLGRFYASPDLVSTTERAHFEKWVGTVPYREVYQPFASIDSVVALAMNVGGPYQLVSIDVEGASVEMFERVPLDALGVLVAIVEYDDKLERLRAYANSRGFDVLEVTSENAVLKRRQSP